MARRLTGVITGDIINSRHVAAGLWLRPLKKELTRWGNMPKQYEIYRGDSFQVEVKDPAEALKAAVLIKAAIKSIKSMDVRLAIGIGTKTHAAARISESNGTAFEYSGQLLETLPSMKMSLAVRTGNPKFDQEMNLMLRLALAIMDTWTVNAAVTVKAALQHPAKSQAELGRMLRIKQNAVSTRLKRAHFDEIQALIGHFRNRTKQLG